MKRNTKEEKKLNTLELFKTAHTRPEIWQPFLILLVSEIVSLRQLLQSYKTWLNSIHVRFYTDVSMQSLTPMLCCIYLP